MSENTKNTETGEFLTRSQVRAAGFNFLDAVAKVKDTAGKAATIKGGALWNAALIYGEVTSRDLIGKSDGALWTTQGNYAASAGFSAATGSLLKRLAAWQGKGAKHSTPTWTFLCDHANNGRVVDVLNREGSKVSDLAPLMAEVKSEGKLTGRAKEAQPDDGSKAETETPDATPEPKVVATLGDVLAVLRSLRPVIHGLSDDDAKKAREAFEAEVAHYLNREVVAGRKAAKKVATPADMPKVATAV